MNHTIHLTISGYPKGARILFDFLRIEENFCSPLYGQLKLFSAREIILDQMLDRHISIETHEQNKNYFHGVVIECIFKGIQYVIDCNHYVYIFKFSSFLHKLKKNSTFRIFANKTIQEVIECLLKPYLTCVISEIQIRDKKIRNYIQYDVTDFKFLHQLFQKHHIFYFFNVTESIETIVITDNNLCWIKPVTRSFNNAKNWQTQYHYNQADKASATSCCTFFNVGSILEFKELKSKQWVVKRIIHQFRELTAINQRPFLLGAIYKNKIYCVAKNDDKPWKEIVSTTPNCYGVEKAIMIGQENIFFKIICPRTKNKSRVTFMRSELRQNKHLTTSFVPQKNQIVILSFEAECLTKGVILGGLFKKNQSWPFDMNQEGISVGSEETQQRLYFDKKDFIIESSGSLNQKVQHNLIATIGGEKIINAAQSMCCQCEHYCMDAKAMVGQVGLASLELNQSGILIKGKKIILN